MKNIQHTNLDGVECLQCTACKDTMSLQFGDWPFWMKLALEAGFVDIHSDCKPEESHPKPMHESLTCTRRA